MLGGVLAIFNEMLCARFLGVHMYGLYALALVLARVGETVSVFGLPVATLRYLSIYRDQNQPRYVLGTIGATLLPPLLLGTVLATIVWLMAPILAQDIFRDASAAQYIQGMAFVIPLLALSEIMGVITRGFGHAGYYVVMRNFVPPVVFLCLLLLIRLFKTDPLWITGAFCVAYLMATLVGVVSIFKVVGRDLFRVIPIFPFRALYTYSLPILLNTVLYLVIGLTGILLLGILQKGDQVGIYRACMLFVIPFDMILIAFNASVGNLYPVLDNNNRREELADLVDKTTRSMSVLALGVLLVIIFNRHDLLLLMGPDFVGGANTLVMLAFAHAALCCVGSAGFLLVISGRQKVETINVASVAVLNVILNLILIQYYGSLGAAIAICISSVLISVLRVVQVKRMMGIQTLRRTFFKILVLAISVALIIYALSIYLPIGEGRGIIGMVIRIGFILALFAALYWSVILNRNDRRAIRDILRGYLSGKGASVL